MGTIRRIVDLQLGSIGTTKVLSLTSSETLYYINSGNRAFEACNVSAYNVFYGQSGLAVNSGGIMIASNGGAKFWDSVIDSFQMAFRVNTGGVTITNGLLIHEYGGN